MKEKKNKKTWLIIVCVFVGIIVLLRIIGLLDEESTLTELENDIGIQAGCYYSGKNPEKVTEDVVFGNKLFCFKENKDFYVVTRGNNQYYKDSESRYSMKEEEGSFKITSDGEDFCTCTVDQYDTFTCGDYTGVNEGASKTKYKYIDIENLDNLEKYPTEEPIKLIYEDNPVDITYRPLDPVFFVVKEHLDSDHKIFNWSANNWAITPININSVLRYTGLDYNTYIENFCLYEIKVDGIIVENISTFIPFGAKTITVTKK